MRKAYAVNREHSAPLARTQYQDKNEKAQKLTKNTEALHQMFEKNLWSREGVEIPFLFRQTADHRLQEFSALQIPIHQWADSDPARQMKVQAMQSVVNGLNNLHAHDIVHRDIKPANMVIDTQQKTPQGKLIDWDTWRSTNSGERIYVCGTPGYLGPEKVGLTNDSLKPMDVFALGVSLYEIFEPEELVMREEDVYTPKISIKKQGVGKNSLAHLIWDMTRSDPAQRPTMAQVALRFKTIS